MKRRAIEQAGFFTILRRELRKRGHDASTVSGVLLSLKSFVTYFYPCHPRELSETDIRGYLLHVQRAKPLGDDQASLLINALNFLYGELYGRNFHITSIPRRRDPGQGRLTGDPSELAARISSIGNAKHRALLSLVCSAGIRLREAVQLRPEDIDVEKHQVRIRSTSGKGGRLETIPTGALEELQFYFKKFKPSGWLFAGQQGGKHLSPSSAQRIVNKAIGPYQRNTTTHRP